MSFISFVFSKTFYKHLAIILLLGVVVLLAAIKGLSIYTHNGDYIEIPILKGCDADSLVATGSASHLRYKIVDSVYDDHAYPGTVMTQNPLPGAKVKPGRRVYLTRVAKMAEMVKMPNLVDLSLRRALDMLEFSHLRIDRIDFEPNMALNAILAQEYMGKVVAPDTLLPKYAPIVLRVGDGYGKQSAAVPFLIGKSVKTAVMDIRKSSLNLGVIDTLASDNFEGDLRVYQQLPISVPGNISKLPLGAQINLVVRSANGFNFTEWVEHFMPQDSTDLEEDF